VRYVFFVQELVRNILVSWQNNVYVRKVDGIATAIFSENQGQCAPLTSEKEGRLACRSIKATNGAQVVDDS